MKVFQSISQRVAFTYQRQLTAFSPVISGQLSAAESQVMHDSQRDLHSFLGALYACAYDDPAVFGLPVTEDVCVNEGDGKDEKQVVARQVKKARVKMEFGIDFLWLLGRQGALVRDGLRLSREDYATYLAKSPRVKRKMLRGMAAVGQASLHSM